jgi:hypothetical protein
VHRVSKVSLKSEGGLKRIRKLEMISIRSGGQYLYRMGCSTILNPRLFPCHNLTMMPFCAGSSIGDHVGSRDGCPKRYGDHGEVSADGLVTRDSHRRRCVPSVRRCRCPYRVHTVKTRNEVSRFGFTKTAPARRRGGKETRGELSRRILDRTPAGWNLRWKQADQTRARRGALQAAPAPGCCVPPGATERFCAPPVRAAGASNSRNRSVEGINFSSCCRQSHPELKPKYVRSVAASRNQRLQQCPSGGPAHRE